MAVIDDRVRAESLVAYLRHDLEDAQDDDVICVNAEELRDLVLITEAFLCGSS